MHFEADFVHMSVWQLSFTHFGLLRLGSLGGVADCVLHQNQTLQLVAFMSLATLDTGDANTDRKGRKHRQERVGPLGQSVAAAGEVGNLLELVKSVRAKTSHRYAPGYSACSPCRSVRHASMNSQMEDEHPLKSISRLVHLNSIIHRGIQSSEFGAMCHVTC